MIHRDVKPSNIFYTFDGDVKVFNFSFSRFLSEEPPYAPPRITAATLPYMAPEQILGAQPTPQFDVYALGLVLWFMLVGRHPFDEFLHDPAALKQAHRHVEPEPLAKVLGLPYLDDVVRGATAKDPGRRFVGMWPLVQALMTARDLLLADARVRAHTGGFAWEGQHPIRTNPEGRRVYMPPTPLPIHAPPPAWAQAKAPAPEPTAPEPSAPEPPAPAALVPEPPTPAALVPEPPVPEPPVPVPPTPAALVPELPAPEPTAPAALVPEPPAPEPTTPEPTVSEPEVAIATPEGQQRGK